MSETTKAAVTVAEMARMTGLGRSRFYQLIGTAFPYPVYDPFTKRPFYVEDQQRICLEVRRRNCGIDGKPILFYAKSVARPPSIKKQVSKAVPVNAQKELVDGLLDLGMRATPAHVNDALKSLYPSGSEGVDFTSKLVAVFTHLQSKLRLP